MRYFFVTFLILCINLYGISLWRDDADFYTETKARKLGDIVTIIINEYSTATNKATTKTKGQNNLSITQGTGPLRFLPGADTKIQNDFSGDATTTRTGNIKAKITARIIRILPNGDFLISGTRRVVVNSEVQEIEIRGIARPEDIGPDNTILSSYLADAQIMYRGKGAVGDIQKPGILNKLFQFLF